MANSCAIALKVVFNQLMDGPKPKNNLVYERGFHLLLTVTNKREGRLSFSEDNMYTLLSFATDATYKNVAYRVLQNLFSDDDDVPLRLFSSTRNLTKIINMLLSDIYSNIDDAPLACCLLSKILRDKLICKKVLPCFNPLDNNLQKLISMLEKIDSVDKRSSIDEFCNRVFLGALSKVLFKLSWLPEVRKELIMSDNNFFKMLLPYMSYRKDNVRKGIVDLVYNCSSDSENHKWIINDEVDLLSSVLLPLARPEHFDSEDCAKMLIARKHLPDSKTREHCSEIRIKLVQILDNLCTSQYGRQYLRDHNVYKFLKILFDCETDSFLQMPLKNVMDTLNKSEEKISDGRFKTIGVQTDFEMCLCSKC